MQTKCRNKHRWPYILIPIFRVSNLLASFPPPVASRHSYLGNAFLEHTNTRTNLKPPHARARSLLLPEGKARPRKLSKDKGSILRVWWAAWFPTKCRYKARYTYLWLSWAGSYLVCCDWRSTKRVGGRCEELRFWEREVGRERVDWECRTGY